MLVRRSLALAVVAITVGAFHQNSARATHDVCTEAKQTHDGFVTIRHEPNANSKPVARVAPGDWIIIPNMGTEDTFENRWLKVRTIVLKDKRHPPQWIPLEGYVYGNLVKGAECPRLNF